MPSFKQPRAPAMPRPDPIALLAAGHIQTLGFGNSVQLGISIFSALSKADELITPGIPIEKASELRDVSEMSNVVLDALKEYTQKKVQEAVTAAVPNPAQNPSQETEKPVSPLATSFGKGSR